MATPYSSSRGLRCVSFFKSRFWELFFKFLCVYLLLKKLFNKTYFSVKRNLTWFPEKYFSFIWEANIFWKLWKKIRNVILLFWIFVFKFHPLEFNFYINFGPYFYNCYLLFPYYFLIKIFYLSNLVLFFWLLLILFEIIYEILIIIILISSSFNF
jgi:hypothetical protein